MFVLARYLNRLKSMTFFHYLLFIEMLIGIIVLHTFLTIDGSIQSKFKEMSQDAKNSADNLIFVRQVNDLSPRAKEPVQNTVLPFTESDLSAFQKSYGDKLSIQINILQNQNYIYNNTVETLYILFVTENFYLDNNGYDLSATNNTAFVGDQAIKIIESGTMAMSLSYQLKTSDNINQIQVIMENNKSTETINMKKMDQKSSQTLKLNTGEITIDLRKTIILPINLYFQNNMGAEGDSSNINISFHFPDPLQSFHIKNEILQYMIDKYSDTNITFMFDTHLDQFLRLTNDMKRISEAVSALSIFSLFIMGTGLVGLMIQLVQKRKKELAICKSMGASNMQLSMEIVLETLSLTLLPALIAIILSKLISNHIDFKEFFIIQSLGVSLLAIAFSLFIGLAAISLSIYKIRSIYPVIEMRGE